MFHFSVLHEAQATMEISFSCHGASRAFTGPWHTAYSTLAPTCFYENVLYLSSVNLKEGRGSGGLSFPDYRDFCEQVKSFDDLGASTRNRANLSDDRNAPESYGYARITANGFRAIGQAPILGRAFIDEDERPGAEPVAVLTFALWEQRYGQDASLIGRKIRIDSVPTTVIGVMPKGLSFPPETDFWQSLVPDGKEKREDRYLSVFGKLAPGVSLSHAQAEVTTVARRLAAQYPDTNKDIQVSIQRFTDISLKGHIRTVFLVLLGAVGFVLLIACANVANLMLARAVGRAREISIRAALGAGRWRVIRQLLIESLLISTAGGLIGWVIALWGIRTFDAAVIPTGKPLWIDFSMDYRALAYLAVISIGTSLLFGLAPALRLARMDVSSALKDGGRGAGTGLRSRYLSGILVVTEMSLAVVLLAGAGLMIRSFLFAYTRPMGANTAGILTMRLELPESRYGKPEQQLSFERSLTERLKAVPGIENAAVVSIIPGAGSSSVSYEPEGAAVDIQRRPSANKIVVGDGFFEILQVVARRGRMIVSETGPPEVIVNQTFANKCWPGADPVGRRLRLIRGAVAGPWKTVAGVIPDILPSPQRTDPDPVIYVPFRQEPQTWMGVLMRSRIPPASLGQAFRDELKALDPDLPVRDLRTLDDQIALGRWPLRVFGVMFAIFASIALLLATVGLYAVVSYGVNQRSREIGIRVALGASSVRILGMVFSHSLRQLGMGMGIGLAAAFGITRVLAALLVGVSPTDTLTFTLVALVLFAAAMIGCAVPARRAIRVDPAVALRDE
jgi:putative ABC transport system permease protein